MNFGVVPAKAGTHNPWYGWLAKQPAIMLNRNSAPYGSRPAYAERTWPGRPDYYCTISSKPAAPMPPPTHMVTTAYFALRRRPSISA